MPGGKRLRPAPRPGPGTCRRSTLCSPGPYPRKDTDMPQSLGPVDRLRIERLVWMLDQQIYDLPRSTRVATRREVRANLLEAAGDVGTTEALRRVGGSRRLAEQYLSAEFGDRPRHTWVGAAYAAALTPLLLNFFLGEA